MRRSLPRLFAVIGAVICTLALAGFGSVHLRLAVDRLERLAEANNAALCHALATLLQRDYDGWLAAMATREPAAIAADPGIARLRADVATMKGDTAVVKVKIYDTRGIAVFSSDARQIGEDKAGNAGFRAALGGEVASIIVHRDRFDAFEGVIEDRDLISSYVPFRGVDGQIRGVFEIYADITEFRREIDRTVAWEMLLLLACFGMIYGALLYTVIAGNRALARQHAESLALAASVARAEAASEQKSQFLATMSHELRTPLNAIIGFSEMMVKGVFGALQPARYRDYADDILKSGTHLLNIVSDILEFSKGDAGGFRLSIEPIDGVALVRDCADMMRGRVEEGGLVLAVEADPALSGVVTDRLRLKQILLNLLSNAIKFTPAGGVVTLQARVVDDGRVAEFSVRDTGIGIAAEDIALCLAPFGQVEGALARQHGGTGLGLPLARKFTELLGGTLAIESAPRRGTTVTVRLPAVASTEAAARRAA